MGFSISKGVFHWTIILFASVHSTNSSDRFFILVGNTLNLEIHLIIILKLISYLTQNTLHLPYKDQLR